MINDNQIITIEKADYVDGYKINLKFNDNSTQIIDFKNFILTSHNPVIAK